MHDALCLDAWDAAVAAYLSSRHAIGRAYRKEELILRELRSFLMRAGAADLDPALFERWRAQFHHLSSSTRVVREHTVYKLCRYRRRSDPGCFLPDRESLARQKPHALPTIIEPEQVAQLLAYVSQLPSGSRSPVRAHAMRLAVVLLYTAGLRRGELVRLTLGDVDVDAGVLRIRESKFHKSRWVPLSVSAQAELRRYLTARQQARLDEHPAAPLLCTRGSRAYTGEGLYSSLKHQLRCAGIHDSASRCPRVQDFRHSFAASALLRWYNADADVQSNLPKLALYMGHVSIVSTAYYLRWMPAVVSQASDRFARSCAGVIDGDAP
ncbi:tyrosine-type recombinase/integrase [Aromatoleum bremense]|uniref:Tyrosine-type recombinase/integrase n=1 Tax=Aromatoleum bremense TaxID=76115 RepID=A0ABX1NT42_9RHOO|nr:tyrosine-type recombinase/integrase [Aromatoleum bremense]NMG15175.1 tyrosine-type recombinase/integrase [Aromatoleum bremense]QTQ32981.1 Integrase, phage related [Aromatoleum bremense]